MLLENRNIAVAEGLNTPKENLAWKLWKMGMMNRSTIELAPAKFKDKLANRVFKDTWVKDRTALHFAPKSFSRLWKERNK